METGIRTHESSSIPQPTNLRKLKSVREKPSLHLVTTQGQLQIHTASYRGSFSVVLSEALRSAGLGSKVLIAQFLKGGVTQGPKEAIHLCGRLEWVRPAFQGCITDLTGSTNSEVNNEMQSRAVNEVWNFCKQRLDQNDIQKIVLDEIGLAVSLGFITENDLISTLNNRPGSTDIILTGPSIPSQIMKMADQVTELRSS